MFISQKYLANTFIVVPAKDESTRISGVLKEISENGFKNIIVVNDGSQDHTEAVARQYGAVVVSHHFNMGAGAATQTGVVYALRRGAEIIVTIDADHQHSPSDIKKLVAALIQDDLDIVIGSRFFGNNKEIPFHRFCYNKIANWVAYFFTGMWVNDSQSGMKAFRARFARQADITQNGFEFCIEMLQNMRRLKVQWAEVPISVKYTEDTLKKGQSFLSGMRMMFRLLRWI